MIGGGTLLVQVQRRGHTFNTLSCHREVAFLAPLFPVYTASDTRVKNSFHLAPFEEIKTLKILTRNPLIWNAMRFLFQVVPLRAMLLKSRC